MKPRCLLAAVDRLPTISELQESDAAPADGSAHSADDPAHYMDGSAHYTDGSAHSADGSAHSTDPYLDSIKELSQPASYPLHGPLRGHRCWRLRAGPGATPVAASWFLNASRLAVDPADVSFTLTGRSGCGPAPRVKQSLLDVLMSPSLFAGLA